MNDFNTFGHPRHLHKFALVPIAVTVNMAVKITARSPSEALVIDLHVSLVLIRCL